ncbi:hypothetical protein NQZ68_038692 [Dissostichus eleginoides]|nr:hypothetical protein NQZ68_038692 [Dissostichus eleginoides]
MESLEKQLICPICLEIFTKPVVILPCQHNLCRKCANDVFQASNPYLTTRSGSTVSSGGRFRCPSCRHEVVLDRHGVYGLQRNLLVENIIDMFNQGSARAAPGKQNLIDMFNQGSARAAPGKRNLIDMFNQGSASRPAPEQQLEPRCETHEEEKINIYCVSCSMPTCSLCKVFGPHRDCMVAPLEAVCTQQKAELTDCISSLVGTNERTQAIISQLEDTCRTIDESGRRQKSQVCEACDQLFALLEERKAMLTLRISCEQEEKLLYVRSLSRKYREHLENTASLLESSLRALDTKEMAQFLQTAKPLLQKMVEGSDTSHLDQVTPGYENMDHLTGSFEPQRRALMGVDFIKLDEDDDDDDDEEEEVAEEVRRKASTNQKPPLITSANQKPPLMTSANQLPPLMTSANQKPPLMTSANQLPPLITSANQLPPLMTSANQKAPLMTSANQLPPPMTSANQRPPVMTSATQLPPLMTSANQLPSLSPAQSSGVQLLATPPQRPSEAPPTMTSSTNGPAPSSSTQAPPTTNPAPQEESEDGPKHIFSFSWLNQK